VFVRAEGGSGNIFTQAASKRAGAPDFRPFSMVFWHHAANRRLALVNAYAPSWSTARIYAQLELFAAVQSLQYGRRPIGEGDDPILQEIAARIGLNVARHVS